MDDASESHWPMEAVAYTYPGSAAVAWHMLQGVTMLEAQSGLSESGKLTTAVLICVCGTATIQLALWWKANQPVMAEIPRAGRVCLCMPGRGWRRLLYGISRVPGIPGIKLWLRLTPSRWWWIWISSGRCCPWLLISWLSTGGWHIIITLLDVSWWRLRRVSVGWISLVWSRGCGLTTTAIAGMRCTLPGIRSSRAMAVCRAWFLYWCSRSTGPIVLPGLMRLRILVIH